MFAALAAATLLVVAPTRRVPRNPGHYGGHDAARGARRRDSNITRGVATAEGKAVLAEDLRVGPDAAPEARQRAARVRDGLALSEEALRAHYEATKLRYAERQLRVRRRPFASREAAERALGEVAPLEGQGAETIGLSPVRELPRTVLPEALRLERPGERAVAGGRARCAGDTRDAGSAWTFVPAGLVAALFVLRTRLGDRTLRRELDGYEPYARRTRFRLVPGVW